MAMMTIRLLRNPKTGKQSVIVKLDSDADALPTEHENMHKELVEKLVGKGLKLEDLGEIIIERETSVQPQNQTQKNEPAKQMEKQAGKQGAGQ